MVSYGSTTMPAIEVIHAKCSLSSEFNMLYIRSILSLFYWFTRPLIKWFLRKTTKLCELQRICYGEVSGAPRVLAVEKCLNHSRNPAIRELLHLYDTKKPITRGALQQAITTVINIKRINPRVWRQCWFNQIGTVFYTKLTV